MATLFVWFYVVVIIVFRSIVSLLYHRQLYKHLWLLIISLLISVVALTFSNLMFVIVMSEIDQEPGEYTFIVASAIGLILYAVIALWTCIFPIMQYWQLK